MAWATEALRGYGQTPAPHHAFLLNELERVACGDTDRLMIFMPPGSGKSRYTSIVFPLWFMALGTGRDIIGASYAASLALDFSAQTVRMAKEHAETLGYGLVDDGRELWHTTNRGTYRAAGAGGGITGRRADLVLIDDPIKGREDADSETIREKIWSWYRAEVITRLKPRGRIVLIQTRWHEDDLAGRLLAEMESGTGDNWRVISLPAIAEDDDALGREPGEALWPGWENVEALQRKRAAIGEREWSALFQQRPRPLEGAMFKPAKLATIEATPICSAMVRAWDFAGTAQKKGNNPDWTVGLKFGRTKAGNYVVCDLIRFRGGPDEVLATVVNTASADGRAVQIRIPQDPGQAGLQQVQYYTRELAGYAVTSDRETGDKATRADPVASQVNVGNVSLVRAAWNAGFREELASFPSGTHDDQVDALSAAFGIVGLGSQGIHIDPAALQQLRMMRPAYAR